MQSVCLQTTVVFIGVAYHNGGGGAGINTLYIDLFVMFCFVLFLIIYSMFVISLKPFIFVLLYLVCIEHVKNNL